MVAEASAVVNTPFGGRSCAKDVYDGMPDNVALNFALPPPPRRVRTTKRGRIVRWIVGSILVFFLVAIIIGCNYGYRRSLAFFQHGAVTKATVVDKDESDDYYHVTMDYVVDGNKHEKTFSVTKAQYHGWALHDDVDITYLPNDPQDAEVGRETAATVKSQKDVVIGFLILYLPFAWLIYLLCDIAVRRQRRLVRFGLLTQCMVTDVYRRRDGGLNVDYQFEVNGTQFTSRDYVGPYVPAVIGQPLMLLYMERRPRDNMLLDNIRLVQPW